MLGRATSRTSVPCACTFTARPLVRMPWYLRREITDGRHDEAYLPRARVWCRLVASRSVDEMPRAFRGWMMFSYCIQCIAISASDVSSSRCRSSKVMPSSRVTVPTSVQSKGKKLRVVRNRARCRDLELHSAAASPFALSRGEQDSVATK